MKPFIHDDFLLQTPAARELYHRYAKDEPVYDYHCHLPPELIARNHRFADLSEIWLGGDHYKWRAMRANGVPERLCTGEGTPREKFDAWCATVPRTLGNPLYHWSHLELKRTFGIDGLIGPDTADAIWDEANAKLAEMKVRDILAENRVAVICTTDDPADSLAAHAEIAKQGQPTVVYPTFRPDRALGIRDAKSYNSWLDKLAAQSQTGIESVEDLLMALKKRHDDFHAMGGRLSDHGLAVALAEKCPKSEADAIFNKVRAGQSATHDESVKFGSFLMLEFGRWDAARGWTKQLHLGAMRNVNTRLFESLGADSGLDSIGDYSQISPLARYLDALDITDELPRTVLYNINPRDNYTFATMAGNFQDGSIPGKVQFGSGWWFLDQKEAMEWQLSALSNLGLLSRFVGMLTDSRSFLSYARHEYFRRVLCNYLGNQITAGELPHDYALVGEMVRGICFANARDYFGLELTGVFEPTR